MDPNNEQAGIEKLILCIPVYNDWEAVEVLIERLDHELAMLKLSVSILIVDDSSTETVPAKFLKTPSNIDKIEIIHLRRNLGHQRAIAMGLSYIYANYECHAVLIMDGDGEDDPSDVKTLIVRCREKEFRKIIFAKRSKRSDGIIFKLGYISYKLVHYLLTGLKVEVGNFSIIPYSLLNRLMGVSAIWNHYAASVFHAKLPLEMIPIPRGQRIAGKSKMNYTSLIVHGMSAISVFGETVAVRLLCVVSLLMILTIGGLVATVLIKFHTDLAIPGWATNLTGILGIVLLNLFLLAIFSVLMMLNSRDRLSFLPIRDWQYFIENSATVHDGRIFPKQILPAAKQTSDRDIL
jgi:glycosyltransferase involved in cell wall biosynthesis